MDNFLLQSRYAKHATTQHSPAKLFKGRDLRAQLQSVDTSDVTFYCGIEYRPSTGIVVRPLGRRMVKIINLADGSIHQRHVDQIRW